MVRRIFVSILLSALLTQLALADPITYRQLRPETGAAFTRLPAATLSSDNDTRTGSTTSTSGQQGGRAVESPNHPEFVRLPDGRIVKYGPGIICDENSIDAMPLARSRVSRNWYVLPPVLAAGILCAVLCRGGGGASEPLTGQPPVVIQPSPSPTIAVTPTPPAEVPEPGTLVLVTVGLGAFLARRKRLNKLAE